MIAAIAMGNGVLPPPATFDITILMVALTIHFVVAIILAIVFADRRRGALVVDD